MKATFIKHIRLISAFTFLLVLILVAEVTGLREQFSLENIKNILQNHFLISAFAYILLFTIGNILQVPGWIFLSAALLTLGKISGYFLTLTAAITSAIVGFYFIRFIGGSSLRKIKWKWVQKLLSTIDQHPIRANIILRIVFQTAPPLNYTLAMSGIKFKDYLLGALLGLPIPILFYTLFIDELAKKVLSQ